MPECMGRDRDVSIRNRMEDFKGLLAGIEIPLFSGKSKARRGEPADTPGVVASCAAIASQSWSRSPRHRWGASRRDRFPLCVWVDARRQLFARVVTSQPRFLQ